MKRIQYFILALSLMLTGIPTTAFASELVPELLETDKVSTDDILLYSSSCVVMDTQSGAILYSKNRSDKHYPASTTKILTTLLALERTQLTDNITFSKDMAIIASAAAQNEEFRKIAGTVTYSVENINYKAMVLETDETETDESNGETDESEAETPWSPTPNGETWIWYASLWTVPAEMTIFTKTPRQPWTTALKIMNV